MTNMGEAYRSLRKNAAWARWYALAKIIPARALPAFAKKAKVHPLALNAAYGRVRYWMGDPPPLDTVGWVAFVREAVAAADDRFVLNRRPAPAGYLNRAARKHVVGPYLERLYKGAVFGPLEQKT